MSTGRTPDDVVREIHSERDELARSIADVNRDVRKEIAEKRALAKRALPIAAGVAVAVIGVILVRRLVFRPSPPPVLVERFRLGRFAIVEG